MKWKAENADRFLHFDINQHRYCSVLAGSSLGRSEHSLQNTAWTGLGIHEREGSELSQGRLKTSISDAQLAYEECLSLVQVF